jgi:FAD/FMN-containing dehydrogenase
VKRGTYASISQDDISFFQDVLPEDSQVLKNPDELQGYNTDWMGIVRGLSENRKHSNFNFHSVGDSKVVLRPKSTDEVSRVLRYCNERKLAVVPQGGNTGLVGGSVPVFDEIVMSTELMNKVISLDTVSGWPLLGCRLGF